MSSTDPVTSSKHARFGLSRRYIVRVTSSGAVLGEKEVKIFSPPRRVLSEWWIYNSVAYILSVVAMPWLSKVRVVLLEDGVEIWGINYKRVHREHFDVISRSCFDKRLEDYLKGKTDEAPGLR